MLALPLKAWSSSGGGGFATPANLTMTAWWYPDLSFVDFVMAWISNNLSSPVWISNISQSVGTGYSTNVNYSIVPSTAWSIWVQWSTQINAVSQAVAKEYATLGNVFTWNNFWQDNAIYAVCGGTWIGPATYTSQIVCNYVSRESFPAGKTIGWKIKHQYFVKTNNRVGANSGTVSNGWCNMLTFDYYVMRSNGTLVLIGSSWNIASAWFLFSWVPASPDNINNWLGMIDNTFSWVTSQVWDRILIQVTFWITGTFSWPFASSSAWVNCAVYPWVPWSQKYYNNTDSYRPFQISVA